MKKTPNKKRIGIFVIIGILLLLGLAGHSIIKKFFQEKEDVWVMYFDESIKGLNIGSPIVFKGVEIGKVSNIELFVNPEDLDVRIPVFAEVYPNQHIKRAITAIEKKEAIKTLIEKGLRARLISQSLLTGSLMIELEILPDTPIEYRAPKDFKILEIPTTLSSLGEIQKGLQDLRIRETIKKFDNILTKINDIMDNNANRVDDILINLNKTLISIKDMSRAFNNMAEYLERHPEALLRGKGK
ncbi:MCE family protein [bacterium]|nr:MCE family protein [bacterium]